jgi:hypothetical protein
MGIHMWKICPSIGNAHIKLTVILITIKTTIGLSFVRSQTYKHKLKMAIGIGNCCLASGFIWNNNCVVHFIY